jgi:hypothetical protein
MTPLKIAILEPAFVRLQGHYADVAKRISRELQGRGHSVTVYASEKATGEVVTNFALANIDVRPYFRVPTKWIRNLMGKRFAGWVRLHIRGADFVNLADADLYLWPTLDTSQFLPLRYLQKNRKIVAGAWFDVTAPTFRGFIDDRKSILSKYTLGAYDEHLRVHLAKQIKHDEFSLLPIPFDGRPQQKAGTDQVMVGLFGHIQKSRGENLMSDLTRSIIDSGWSYNLNGVLHQRLPIETASTPSPYVEDISPLIAACHFILWPSDAQHYKLQTSGNTFQCIANGTPIIVPAGCLPAQILDDYGLNYPRFEEQTPEAVMRAAHELVANYDAFKAKALLAADKWRESQGVKKYVDYLLANLEVH